jgi:hypothetical protein
MHCCTYAQKMEERRATAEDVTKWVAHPDFPYILVSFEGRYFNSLFPTSSNGKMSVQHKLGLPYDAVLKLYPDRFNFALINNNFAALAARLPTEYAVLWRNETTVYEFDKLRYCSTRDVVRYNYLGTPQTVLNVRLSNDGFLYPLPSSLNVFQPQVSRHHSATWALLDRTEIARFPAVVAWCDRTALAHTVENIRYQVFYNFMEDRIDVKAISGNGKDVVLVTFEPGFPEEGFDDYWAEPERSGKGKISSSSSSSMS